MTLIEIFKAGKRPDAHGTVVEITPADLQQAVEAYDVAYHEAPAVIGHPTMEAPAYAWVKGLQLDGDVLKAELDQVHPEFADMVAEGRFKKVSASFYLSDSPDNPKQGSLYLRHVGFLGAMPPAVKGLRNPEFSESEQGIVDFCEAMPNEPNQTEPTQGEPEMSAEDKAELDRLRAENQQLKDENAKAKAEKAEAELNQAKADNADFAESLVKAGKLAPIAKQQAVDLLNYASTTAQGGVVEFGEGESLHSKLKAFLDAQPQVVNFGEVATKDKVAAPQDGTVEYAEGTSPEAIDMDKKVRAYMKQHNVGYAAAFDAITQ
ncbi:peptidase [Haemophilus parahaemolyticus]|uniref:peptidase n=1 Tax=Haemophilus parahaemolyticus TaxID=735 RepID=UPI0028E807E7|nr:peptidase [Haemophilus parahaemolyticus]